MKSKYLHPLLGFCLTTVGIPLLAAAFMLIALLLIPIAPFLSAYELHTNRKAEKP